MDLDCILEVDVVDADVFIFVCVVRCCMITLVSDVSLGSVGRAKCLSYDLGQLDPSPPYVAFK